VLLGYLGNDKRHIQPRYTVDWTAVQRREILPEIALLMSEGVRADD
jgi:hypothetical protein